MYTKVFLKKRAILDYRLRITRLFLLFFWLERKGENVSEVLIYIFYVLFSGGSMEHPTTNEF